MIDLRAIIIYYYVILGIKTSHQHQFSSGRINLSVDICYYSFSVGVKFQTLAREKNAGRHPSIFLLFTNQPIKDTLKHGLGRFLKIHSLTHILL